MFPGTEDFGKQIINVASLLEDQINRLGEVKSLVFEEREHTNYWLRENSNRLANGLKSLVGKILKKELRKIIA
ncbi:MAG: hypothetical protein JRJ39_01195 [Deltaproteobacteria bacterium]|nr:hypothetical protein [Deltaproteobacteria bacterium]MBW1812311.1 hypothetical protein [Deltaproteobacteria bacterium]MBW1847682.1 hypothetical protein [Deltaproteobacteria bacterium]MBW2364789.1 hypothetical protein [Deltaproteobacteria bacterium]